MKSVADVFDAIGPAAPPAPRPQPHPNPTPTVTVVADTSTAAAPARERLKDRLTASAGVIRDDWKHAWLWDADGITVRALWDSRIANREQVPAESRALWIGWCCYNHAALAVLVPLMFVAWLLCHPARLLYLTPLAVTAAALWLA